MWLQGECYEFRKAVPRKWLRLGAAAEVAGTVISPMPGKIIQVGTLTSPSLMPSKTIQVGFTNGVNNVETMAVCACTGMTAAV